VKNYAILAWNFRNAIEYAKSNGELNHDITFRNFPSGCCDDASILLSEYLYEHGFCSSLVIGTYYGSETFDTHNHAWLLVNEELIDITVDQFKYNRNFPPINESLFIGRSHELYDYFENQNLYTDFGINSYDDFARKRLEDLYNTIRKYA
jgi:hypothetical protein